MSSQELRRAVYETIRQHPNGITRRALQSRMGISDPALDESRGRVWRVSAAIAGLMRERFVVTTVVDGECFLYPQMA